MQCLSSVQFISVTQSCLTLCDPMNCSTPSLPVHHQLPEFTQTHALKLTQTNIHRIRDAIQPYYPLCPLLLLPSILLSIRVFSSESVLCIRRPRIGVSASASVLPMNTQDWSPLEGMVGSPCSPRDLQESSPTPQFKSISSSALSFLYSPTLTYIHDY